jgi:hypothetical protein
MRTGSSPILGKKRHFLVSLVCIGAAFAILWRAPVDAAITQPANDKTVQASSDEFAWRVDLHPLAYPGDNTQLQWRRGLDQFSTLDFVSEQVVVATFITQEPDSTVQRRDDPNRERPYRLHAIFLDVATHKVLNTLDWPTDNPNAGIFPRYDGSFLFFSTERIVLYSADWSPVKELLLPQLTAPHSYLAGISESPSGNVLVVRYHKEHSIHCVQILTATLDASEGPCTVPELFTISDDSMAASEIGPDRTENRRFGPIVGDNSEPFEPIRNGGSMERLLIRKKGEPFRTFCDCGGIGTSVPQFINNEMIVIYSLFKFGVYYLSAYVGISESRDPRDIWIDQNAKPLRTSQLGQRFAIPFNVSVVSSFVSTRVDTFLGDIPAKFADSVNVYQVETERPIYRLKMNRRKIKEIWGLALSPRGEKLALDSGGVIQMYALPPQKNN